jgi:hypothetical protein
MKVMKNKVDVIYFDYSKIVILIGMVAVYMENKIVLWKKELQVVEVRIYCSLMVYYVWWKKRFMGG